MSDDYDDLSRLLLLFFIITMLLNFRVLLCGWEKQLVIYSFNLKSNSLFVVETVSLGKRWLGSIWLSVEWNYTINTLILNDISVFLSIINFEFGIF